MLNRFKDLAARWLLPLLLFSIALSLTPLGNDAGDLGCSQATATRWVEQSEREGWVDGRLETLAARITGARRIAISHWRAAGVLLLVFSFAYLLFARERRAVRIGAFVGLMLTPVATMILFGHLC